MASKIAFDEIDVLFYFRSTIPHKGEMLDARMDIEQNLLRLCDVQRIPLATNATSAVVMLEALENKVFFA